MDRPEQEDEQGLREVMCERRSVRVRCHDSPHDEAARPCLRTFHTASEGEFCELRVYGVLRSSHWASVNVIIIAVERVNARFGVEAGGRRSSTCLFTWCSSLTPQMLGRLSLTLRRTAVLLSRMWQRPWALGWSATT